MKLQRLHSVVYLCHDGYWIEMLYIAAAKFPNVMVMHFKNGFTYLDCV
jgi:hypothetical protein